MRCTKFGARAQPGAGTGAAATVSPIYRPVSLGYRDALVLWLQFIANDTKRGVEKLELSDFTGAQAERFLTHLEKERGNGVRDGPDCVDDSGRDWPKAGFRSCDVAS